MLIRALISIVCLTVVCCRGVIDYGGPYNFIAGVDYAEIVPKNGEFSSCTLQSELPGGLVLNNETCSITGIPYEIVTYVKVTVESLLPTESSGSFLITVLPCENNAFEVLRTYGPSNVAFELFTVVDAVSHETLVNVTLDMPKKGNQVVSYRFCSKTQQVKITIASTVYEEWYRGSKLEVYSLFPAPEKSLLLACHMDINAGLPTVYHLNLAHAISRDADWFYYTDDLPAGWESSRSTDWKTSHASAFPPSTSAPIHLYKQLLELKDIDYPAVQLDLRFRCGAAVYINGVEVYRRQLPLGPLTNDTVALQCFSALSFHTVILPTAVKGGDAWQALFVPGINIIAIAVIDTAESSLESTFDATLRFTGKDKQFRSFGLVSAAEGFDGPKDAATDWDHETFLTCKTMCAPDANITFSFPESREESITTVELIAWLRQAIPGPLALQIEARVDDASAWVPLLSIPTIEWGDSTRRIRFWIHGSQPYQQYRLTNLETVKDMRITQVNFFTEQMNQPFQPLVYAPVHMRIFTSIGALLPPTPQYFDFTVTPEFPRGVHMNPMTGEITGVPEIEVDFIYKIGALRMDGVLCTANFSLHVMPCIFEYSLYQLHFLTDLHLSKSSWRLLEGLSWQGKVLEEHELPRDKPHNLTYYFCLPQGFYTFHFVENSGGGWTTPAGYTFTTQQETFVIATGTLPRVVWPFTQSNSTFSFDAYQPIQPSASLWHLCLNNMEEEDWTSLSFDDYKWQEAYTDVIPKLHLTNPTLYLRRRFTKDNMYLFTVMRVQIRFSGGVVVYFNGNPVYRFNLPPHPSFNEYAITDHNNTLYEQFTIPLRAMAAKDGENIFAVEMHRAKQSTQSFEFDCIAVLDLNETAVLSTSYASIQGSEPIRGHVANLFDMDVRTLYRPRFEIGTFWEWTFSNQERTLFNEYWINAGNRVMNFTWDVLAKFEGSTDWFLVDSQQNISLYDRLPRRMELPQGSAGFKSLRFEVMGDVSVSVFELMEFFLVYQFPQKTLFCATEGDFIAVEDGGVSYSYCPEGYTGVSSRACVGEEWQPINYDDCLLLPPSSFYYDQPKMRFPSRSVHSFKSHVKGIVEWYEVKPPLPQGMHITSSGTLKGRVDFAVPATNYTIYAINSAGVTSTVVQMEIFDRYCEESMLCPSMRVGETCWFYCQEVAGNTVGKLSQACVEQDQQRGKWDVIKGHCVSMALIVAIVFFGLLLILFLFVQIVRWIAKLREHPGSYRKV